MVSVTASDLDSRLDLSSAVSNANLEKIIDGAVDELNIYLLKYGIQINNMTGTAGSKTLSVTSPQRGAILKVAAAIYAQNFKISGSQSETVTLGPASTSSSSSTTNASSEVLAKELAERLAMEEIEVDIG